MRRSEGTVCLLKEVAVETVRRGKTLSVSEVKELSMRFGVLEERPSVLKDKLYRIIEEKVEEGKRLLGLRKGI